MRLSGEHYTPAALAGLRGPGAPAPGGTTEKRFEWTLSEEALKELVDLIPNPPETDRETWIAVLHGIAGAGGSFETWDGWSSKWPGYDSGDTRRAWDTLDQSRVMSGGGSLRAMAEKADEKGFGAWRQKWEAAAAFPDDVVADADEDEDGAVLALQRDVANLIVRAHGAGIRYNVSTSFWHQFTGIWKESPHDLGYRLAKRWADANAGALGTAARAAVSKSAFYEGVSKIVRADPMVAVVKTDFDRDDWLLGTPAGTVELRTGKLRASAASEMISLSCVCAPAETEDCPRWKAFIDWACTDPATKKADLGMKKMLRQWAGYCLTGDVTREMVFFLHGGGANGKGTFIETMQWVLGDYFYLAAKDLFIETKGGAHTEEIAALAGRRMVAADEVPTNSKWNESLLKGVSGGGTISSRHLYGRVFSFPIKFKVTIIGNEKPRFQGAVNEALKRRLHLVAFRMKADPIIDSFKVGLRAEAAGILRWALGGLAETMKEGKLHIADSSLTATNEYFNENDHFGEWLSENTEVTPGRHGPSSELFKNWKEWAFAQGYADPFSEGRKFKAEMVKRGKVWRETKTGNVFNDLSIKIFDNVQ